MINKKCEILTVVREVCNWQTFLPIMLGELFKYQNEMFHGKAWKWYKALVLEGWQDTVKSMGKEFYMTRVYWFQDSTQSVWNFFIKFDRCYNIKNCTVIEVNSVKRKTCK